ncbi:MAG: hypothetical protein CBB94_11085 [Gammaproteobacteria bacterium TMED34]|nr:MAG: hypothetical protein CBB94_11085 [Gammaproteobacteria bacterium TMED34]
MNPIARANAMLRPSGTMFYGWYIVAGAAGVQFLSGILWMQSYGAYVVLLQEDFGWSKALVAGAFALTRIESGVLGPIQGWLTDRFGPRRILTIGMLIFALGFYLFSQVESIIGFYVTFGLIAIGSSLGGFATVMVSLVNWFDRHRSKAVAFSLMGYSFGGLSVPVIILCLEAFGWRTTAMISAGVILLIGLPMVQLVKHRPSEIGEVIDGGAAPGVHENKQPQVSDSRDFTAREAMRSPAFWFISIGHACSLLTVSTVMVHLVPHLTEGFEYTLAQAGLVVAALTGCQMVGQFTGGYLGDRFDKRIICTICMIFHCLGMVAVALAINVWMVLAFAFLHGLGWGTRGPLMVAMRADYFGASSFGTIMGFSSLISMLGMSIGPIFAGYMADVYGDYELGFLIIASFAFVGSFCFFAATPPKRQTSPRSI